MALKCKGTLLPSKLSKNAQILTCESSPQSSAPLGTTLDFHKQGCCVQYALKYMDVDLSGNFTLNHYAMNLTWNIIKLTCYLFWDLITFPHVCRFRSQKYYINRILKRKSTGVTGRCPASNEQKAVLMQILLQSEEACWRGNDSYSGKVCEDD